MAVDYERCWIALKAVIVEKRSHGQKDLFVEMARIEVESQVPRMEPVGHTNGSTPAVSDPPSGP